jgi:hypothetical protein
MSHVFGPFHHFVARRFARLRAKDVFASLGPKLISTMYAFHLNRLPLLVGGAE